jgi:hypothetical protein
VRVVGPPRSFYSAARVDPEAGATSWQVITLACIDLLYYTCDMVFFNDYMALPLYDYMRLGANSQPSMMYFLLREVRGSA